MSLVDLSDSADRKCKSYSGGMKRRLELAREHSVPPYVIFHDSTLRELASRRPLSDDEMRDLHLDKLRSMLSHAVEEAVVLGYTREEIVAVFGEELDEAAPAAPK